MWQTLEGYARWLRLKEIPGHINASLRSLTTKARVSGAWSPTMPLVNLSSSFSCHPCQHQWNSRIWWGHISIHVFIIGWWDTCVYIHTWRTVYFSTVYHISIRHDMVSILQWCRYATQIRVLWLLALMRLSERSLRLTMQMLTDGSATTGPEVLPPSGNQAGSPGTSTMKITCYLRFPCWLKVHQSLNVFIERGRERQRESLSNTKDLCLVYWAYSNLYLLNFAILSRRFPAHWRKVLSQSLAIFLSSAISLTRRWGQTLQDPMQSHLQVQDSVKQGVQDPTPKPRQTWFDKCFF